MDNSKFTFTNINKKLFIFIEASVKGRNSNGFLFPPEEK
jgi:hypothetical protein